MDDAKNCADYVFNLARMWEYGVKPGVTPIFGEIKLEFNGQRFPRHICRVLNNPSTDPGQGNFENDGHGMTSLYIYNLWRRLPKRDKWLKERWHDVSGLGDWVVSQFANPKVSGATETLQTDSECSGGTGHSIYADMAQMEALKGLAEMADSIGETV